jgi:hypothetical protein
VNPACAVVHEDDPGCVVVVEVELVVVVGRPFGRAAASIAIASGFRTRTAAQRACRALT